MVPISVSDLHIQITALGIRHCVTTKSNPTVDDVTHLVAVGDVA